MFNRLKYKGRGYEYIGPSQQEKDEELLALIESKAPLSEIEDALYQGANPDAFIKLTKDVHTTPFNAALDQGDADLMNLLAKNHAISTEESGSLYNNTMLMETVMSGNHAAIAVVLKKHGSLTEQNDFGDTALHIAVHKNDFDAANLLLIHMQQQKRTQNRLSGLFSGKNLLDIKNKAGFTPHALAMHLEHHDLATLIEQYQPLQDKKQKISKLQGVRRSLLSQ